ncbi:hypothetical protein G7046_g8078 [Stylonectria norvegica]|nr:hypothetical protein G7046_g8078 [Stylonectria norvegica]
MEPPSGAPPTKSTLVQETALSLSPVLKAPVSSDRIVTIDKQRVVNLSVQDELFYRSFSKAQRHSVRNKIDVRLLPVLCALYMFAQLDRSNIGNAKIEGLKQSTNISDKQYNVVLAAFFIPYCFLEIPSNMFLKGLKRPSFYIGALVVAWGIVMTCHGFATNFTGMFILRFCLGACEAGFYPAAVYLCSLWYRPHELAFRLSLFTAVAAASGVASGLLAAGIVKMDGLAGYEGWRWIFIVEGSVTVLFGIASALFLIDTPAVSSKWLTPDEIRYMQIQAFIKDGGDTTGIPKQSKGAVLKDILTDWRYWAFGFILHVNYACGNGEFVLFNLSSPWLTFAGLKFSIPTIIRGLGYSKTKSQMLSAIPYLCGVISAVSTAACSDRVAKRSVFVFGGLASILLGLVVIFALNANTEQHQAGIIVGMCFVLAGIFPVTPLAGSWLANNIITPDRRAIGLAFSMAVGSLGGLTGSMIYVEHQAPEFTLGVGISCGLAGLGLLVVLGLGLSFWRQNRIRAAMSDVEIREAYSESELRALGEKSPLFQYTL